MWGGFLQSYNGISFWRDDLLLEVELQVMSDTASGLGVYFWKHRCTEDWPAGWFQVGWVWDLMFLEFFPIVVAVRVWGGGQDGLFYCPLLV